MLCPVNIYLIHNSQMVYEPTRVNLTSAVSVLVVVLTKPKASNDVQVLRQKVLNELVICCSRLKRFWSINVAGLAVLADKVFSRVG